MSKKVRDNIDRGLWTYYGCPEDGYSAAVGFVYRDWEKVYLLACYKEEMPAFQWEEFTSLDALEMAMRKVQPDMRKWHLSEVG